MRISYGAGFYWEPDSPPEEGDVMLGETIGMSRNAVYHFRRLICIQTALTADEQAVLEAERELEAAVADKRISWYRPMRELDGTWTYRVVFGTNLNPTDGGSWFCGPRSHAEAARAAVEYVRSLPEPKPALPDVETMLLHSIASELAQRGWKLSDVSSNWPRYYSLIRKQGRDILVDETWDEFHRNMLREARRIDGDE